jgi:hypothetical protein
MPGICEKLAELLGRVQRPGDFYASGRLETLAPRLEVEGVGQVALPLLAVQAEQLIAVAKRAPYGRGPETIIDTSVRRTWQIAPDQVRLGGKHWQETLGSYRRRYRGDDEDDSDEFEVVEVHDRWEQLTEWRHPDGGPAVLGVIPIEDGEVAPPDALEDMEPDEEHFNEATGNEGASFERTYRRAALVLWPRQCRLAVINQAGPKATLPYLEALAARWIDEGAQPDSAVWTEAHELSGHMLETWPAAEWYSRGDDRDDDEGGEADGVAANDKRSGLARLLAALTWLGNETRTAAALELLTARRGHDKADNRAILGAAALFPPECAAQMIEAIVARHASAAIAPSCALLRAAITGPFATAPKASRHCSQRSHRVATGRSGARPRR